MVKHTQAIRRQIADECLSVFDHFVKLALIGLTIHLKNTLYNDLNLFIKTDGYGRFLPLKSESLGHCYVKSLHNWKKSIIWIGMLTDLISFKKFLKLFIVNFGQGFYCSKSMFLSQAPNSRHKKNRKIIFAGLYFY